MIRLMFFSFINLVEDHVYKFEKTLSLHHFPVSFVHSTPLLLLCIIFRFFMCFALPMQWLSLKVLSINVISQLCDHHYHQHYVVLYFVLRFICAKFKELCFTFLSTEKPNKSYQRSRSKLCSHYAMIHGDGLWTKKSWRLIVGRGSVTVCFVVLCST